MAATSADGFQAEEFPAWDSLPIPALEEIARRLEAPDQKGARLACWQWYRGITREMGCQLDLLPDAEEWQRQLEAMASREDGIQRAEVYISSRVQEDVAAEQIAALTRMTSLQSLTLNMDWVPLEPVLGLVPPYLPPALTLLSALTFLSVKPNTQMLPSTSQLLSLAALPHLRSLSLGMGGRLPDISPLLLLTQLVTLVIDTFGVDLVPDQMVKSLVAISSLQELQLGSIYMGWQQLSLLVANLGCLTHLHCELYITDNTVDELLEAAKQLGASEPLTVIPSAVRHLPPGSPGNPFLSMLWDLWAVQEVMPHRVATVQRVVWGLGPNLRAFTTNDITFQWTTFMPPSHSPPTPPRLRPLPTAPSRPSTPPGTEAAPHTAPPTAPSRPPLFPNLQHLNCRLSDPDPPLDDADTSADDDPPSPPPPSTPHPAILAAFRPLTALRSIHLYLDNHIAAGLGPHVEAWVADLPALTSLSFRFMPDHPNVPHPPGELSPLSRLQHLQQLRLLAGALQVPLGCLPPSLTSLHCHRATLLHPTLHGEPLGPSPTVPLSLAPTGDTGAHQQFRGGAVHRACGTYAAGGQLGSTSSNPPWGGLPRLQRLQLNACWLTEAILVEMLGACPQLLDLILQGPRLLPQPANPTTTATTTTTRPVSPTSASTPPLPPSGAPANSEAACEAPCADDPEAACEAPGGANDPASGGAQASSPNPMVWEQWVWACPTRLTMLQVTEHDHNEDGVRVLTQRSLAGIGALTRLRQLYMASAEVNSALAEGRGAGLLQQALAPLQRLHHLYIVNAEGADKAAQLTSLLQPLPLADTYTPPAPW